MDPATISLGALVAHPRRPGIWRLIDCKGAAAVIEPWDDQAAATLHASEAYSIRTLAYLLCVLRPGPPPESPEVQASEGKRTAHRFHHRGRPCPDCGYLAKLDNGACVRCAAAGLLERRRLHSEVLL